MPGDCVNFQYILGSENPAPPSGMSSPIKKRHSGHSLLLPTVTPLVPHVLTANRTKADVRVQVSGLLLQETDLPSSPAVSEPVTLVSTTLIYLLCKVCWAGMCTFEQR